MGREAAGSGCRPGRPAAGGICYRLPVRVNGFLLGHLLLETSAMTLRDPKPGDGFFGRTDTASSDGGEPAGGAPADPVLGALSPARSAEQRGRRSRTPTARAS